MMSTSRVWSGGIYDGHLVVFCDQDGDGILASRENGRIVVRSLGGTWLGLTYDSDTTSIAAWLDATANTALGQVSP